MSNNSIFELAQLLTGALDENFNIKNQTAVIKVVSCLEAFNITHDSYREVQNTRLIKDLQALRQNKANDQLLAKRIKNLLRKWKERLATAVVTSNNNSSHPNSPQNFSQGSSDATIFMAHHSLSPPNSLPPTQHAQQMIVNGPTTFANVIPKGIIATTSPALPLASQQRKQQQQSHLNTNHNSHNHKNGGFELAAAAVPGSTNLLGKRKFEGHCNDIDENSNHSRKKMMKKSAAAGPISSPQIPPPLPIVMNNPKIVPVLQPTPPFNLQQQQQQVINSLQEEAPKKRGRRKGSRGIDSTLNGNAIPDFQTEIQQKIYLSAGKRNLTTSEIQKKLSEAHQQQNASASAIPSLASEDSVDNRVPFMPSSVVTENEKRAPISHKKAVESKIKVEDVSEPLPPVGASSSSSQLDSNTTSRSLTTEEEIKRLESLLPPINYKAAARDIFGEYVTLDDDGNIVECTCTFREVVTYADEIEQQQPPSQINGGLEVKIEENGDSFKLNSKFSADEEDDDDDDDETDDFCAVEMHEKSPTPPPMKSAVKSIFDPEYDANENLIEEMVRSRKLIRDAPSKVIEVKIEKDNVKSTRMETMLNNFEPDNVMLQQQSERVPIINYECDEDPMCPARAHFRRNSVTKRDLDRLHNSYVPGVNGNFNGILEPQSKHDYSKDSENIDYKKHQLWKRVVPRYNFLTLDDVPKKFDLLSPYSIPPTPTDDDNDEKDDNDKKVEVVKKEEGTINGNNLMSFDDLMSSHSEHRDIEFREWYQPMNVRSYKDEILTILPYVVID